MKEEYTLHNLHVAAENNTQKTRLHVAAENGDELECILQLIVYGVDVNARDGLGRTPLHGAAEKGHLDFCQLLIENGANVNVKDNYHSTPLHGAAEKGRLEVCQLLLDKGANVNAATKDTGETPLHCAAAAHPNKQRHVDVAQLLLDRGATIDARAARKETPLHFSVSRGHLGASKLLLERGANIEARDNEGHTPLSLVAREGGKEKACRFLIEHQANQEAKNKKGLTPFCVAVLYNNEEICQLLKKPENINEKYTEGQTLLMLAAQGSGVEACRFLIEECGADIGIRDDAGRTVLHHAASGAGEYGDDASVCAWLMRRNDDIHVIYERDNNGRVPLHYGALRGHTAICRFLIARGAKVTVRDNQRQLPIELAPRNNRELQVLLAPEMHYDELGPPKRPRGP